MSLVSRRARRALLAAAVPAALAATALPASADAATARVSSGTLQYTAAAGETNDVRVFFDRPHIVIDDTAPITAVGDGCAIDVQGRALCVPGTGQAQYSLGNGRDVMRYDTPHAARIDMGADDDTYFGFRVDSIGTGGLVVQPADLIGGAGADLMSYRFSQRAVRVSLDGVLNDGDRSKDNVRPDWEHIVGSNFKDTLTGTDVENKIEEYTGLNGDDTMFGLNGTDIFNEGSAPNGADDFHGQAGIDRINYSQRTTGVRVDMASLAGNSGAAGEGDFIDPNTNDALGGSGVDTMIGGSGANAFAGGGGGDTLEGGGGPDSLFGNAGVDTLVGGADPDSLFGGSENDTLDAGDNTADTRMDCESGTGDRLIADLNDRNASNCETVEQVGILKLAPTAITAEAGKAAKVRMTWSHPKSWKQLRNVELRIERDGKAVGKVAVRVAAKRLQADGAVKLLRASRLATKGKKVTAHLALKLDKSLAGETLSVDVEATDVKGKRQLQNDAGTIRVS
jgi:RTX calcium-binding nonapeptide repeat (4 copies)